MRLLRKLFYLIICIVVISCNENKANNKNSKNYEGTDTLNSFKKTLVIQDSSSKLFLGNSYSENCIGEIRDLVANSSIKRDIPADFVIIVDDSTNTTYTLEIANKHEETGDMIAIKWLILDLKKQKLSDITDDPDNPLQIITDSLRFNEVMKCLKRK